MQNKTSVHSLESYSPEEERNFPVNIPATAASLTTVAEGPEGPARQKPPITLTSRKRKISLDLDPNLSLEQKEVKLIDLLIDNEEKRSVLLDLLIARIQTQQNILPEVNF